MATVTRRTPGVYVTEVSAFPPSVIGVQTAVPAFIGYTKKAEISGKPVLFQAIKIGSLADFQAIFGNEYDPVYTISEVTTPADINAFNFDFKVRQPTSGATPAQERYYNLQLPQPPAPAAPQFNLYNSMRLFYDNGGGECYVVSVGLYKKPEGSDNKVEATKLIEGLDVIKEQVGPTILVVPDAVLLPPDASAEPWVSAEFKSVVRAMLDQCALLQDRMSILDVYGSLSVTNQLTLDQVIQQFRTDVDGTPLNYGAAYFPFLESTVVPLTDYDYTNITPIDAVGDLNALKTILLWEDANIYNGGVAPPGTDKGSARYEAVKTDILAMTPAGADAEKLTQNLTAALPLLGDMLRIIAAQNDVLPSSPAMAGVYTRVDGSAGVWNAPANVTLSSVAKTTYKLNSTQQGDLNVPIDGKAIDALREFTGRGTVVWGARTLDGNSNDYRYIQVRRTLIYIEQSIKNALNQFVFAPNDANTWSSVVSMVSSFLDGVWQQGGLMGAKSSDAFSVACGIGSTMTGQDILNGYMIVQVVLQMIRPAEFIELIFKQKMEGVA